MCDSANSALNGLSEFEMTLESGSYMRNTFISTLKLVLIFFNKSPDQFRFCNQTLQKF